MGNHEVAIGLQRKEHEMLAVKGLYEHGAIKLTEKVDVGEKVEVVVTFLESVKGHKDSLCSAAGSWKDMDTAKIKQDMQESRSASTRGEVSL